MRRVYKDKDLILPILDLKNPCTIKIIIDEENIFLEVGPRDWQWDRKTGELIGAGTYLGG